MSIVIPTYNRSHFVERTINSAIGAAEGREIEIIIVDDHSDDIAHLRQTLKRYGNVRLIENSERKNAAYSRNVGLLNSSHRDVFFLDSDDEFSTSHIGTRLALSEHGQFGITFGNYTIVHRNGVKLRRHLPPYCGNNMRDYLFRKRSSVVSSSLHVDRRYHRGTIFDDAMNKHQDWGFAIRSFDNCERIGFDPHFGVILHQDDPGKMSSSMDMAATEYFVTTYLSDPTQRNLFYIGIIRTTIMRNDRSSYVQFRAKMNDEILSGRQRITMRGLDMLCKLRLFNQISHATRLGLVGRLRGLLN